MHFMTKANAIDSDPEIAAIGVVFKALENLEPDARARVLLYVASKLRIDASKLAVSQATIGEQLGVAPEAVQTEYEPEVIKNAGDELEGISPVAKKWMARNSLHAKALSSIFSLGVDEIDLIAKDVPGGNKKDRMRSVFLLKGVAAYLGSGVSRFSNEQIKEACLHYKAYDPTNFATYLKSFSGDVSGDKGSGYTLTARGLSTATEMVKLMLNQPEAKT
jgi:hypothetical protein